MKHHRAIISNRQAYPFCGCSSGFTLVEVALVLAVLGVIASAAAAAYLGLFSASRNKLIDDASLATMSGAVIAFAKTHNRLPCPDPTGTTGNEGLVAGVCPAGREIGWFPYLTAGLTLPAPRSRAVYGVYRVAGADLARAEEHGGDSPGAATYADQADFVRALQFAALQAPTNAHIYVTGDGATSGVENCASNVVSNPAFVVLTPGEDRNGDGNVLDGIHSTLPGTGHCFSSPTRAVDTNFDDRTMMMSFYSLMAKLNNEL